MRALLRLLAVLGLALLVASVAACDGLSFFEPGQIVVRNVSDAETVVLAVLGDDFKSYPTLGPGRNANVQTEVGGNYQVIVVMSQVDAQTYRNNLQLLKRNVQAIVDGTASNEEKVKYFSFLGEINSAISAGQNAGGPSCTGKLTLDESKPTNVAVQVSWVPKLGSGVWSLTCGSN